MQYSEKDYYFLLFCKFLFNNLSGSWNQITSNGNCLEICLIYSLEHFSDVYKYIFTTHKFELTKNNASWQNLKLVYKMAETWGSSSSHSKGITDIHIVHLTSVSFKKEQKKNMNQPHFLWVQSDLTLSKHPSLHGRKQDHKQSSHAEESTRI